MVLAMTVTLHTSCGHILLPLTVALLGACVANLLLVYAWL
jgi:hypothetical protein